MKKAMVLFALILGSLAVNAQQVDSTSSQNKNEIGVMGISHKDFGLTFRWPTKNPQRFWRTGIGLSQGGNIGFSHHRTYNSIGTDVFIGNEWRKPISDKVDFRLGADINSGYSYDQSENEHEGNSSYRLRQSFSFGLNAVVGFQYQVFDNFLAGIEILPGVRYSKYHTEYTTNGDQHTDENDSFSYRFKFKERPVTFSLVYQF